MEQISEPSSRAYVSVPVVSYLGGRVLGQGLAMEPWLACIRPIIGVGLELEISMLQPQLPKCQFAWFLVTRQTSIPINMNCLCLR